MVGILRASDSDPLISYWGGLMCYPDPGRPPFLPARERRPH